MSFTEFAATGLVVGVIGPLFWLTVNVFDGWMQRNVFPKIRRRYPWTSYLLGKQIGRREPSAAPDELGRPAGVGKKQIRG